jgi:hypothetical protein
VTVQEVAGADGQWSLTLKPGTPGSVRDRLKDYFCLLKVFAARPGVDQVVHLQPFYTGVLLRSDSPYEAAGAGPNWFLGESATSGDQIGPVWDNITGPVNPTAAAWSLTQWSEAAADQAGLGYGSFGSHGTWTGRLTGLTPRTLIDVWMTAGFGVDLEYRVTSGLNLSVGTTSDLYRTPGGNDINTVLVSRDASRTGVAPDGLHCSQLDVSLSAEDLMRRVVINSATASPVTQGASAPTWPYKNPAGGTLDRILYTKNDDVSTADMPGAVSRLLSRNTVSVTSPPPMRFVVGDWVWVWAPERDLYSLTNTVQYGGRSIFPSALRVTEMTWPLRAGLGIYLDNTPAGGVVTDLSDYIEAESGDTSLTVGALHRTLGYLPLPAA